jgi:CheY-like chemotaxis protein
VTALNAEDKTVRFAAAIALLELDPAYEFPGADMVIPLAAQAAPTGRVRQILQNEPDAGTRANTQKALDDAGLYAVAEAGGMAGYIRAKEVGTFDVIVMRYNLADELSLKLVRELRRDFRTAGVPILISGTGAEMDEAKGMFGPSVQGYVDADAIDIEAVKAAASQSMNDDQKMALMVSKAACDALAGFTTAHTAFANYAGAEGALMEILGSDRPDDIRIAALNALGNVGSGQSVGAIVDTFGKSANSTSVRVAAAAALGHVLRGMAAPVEAFDALLGGLGDEAQDVRGAAGAALGAMMLTPEQLTAVLKYRVE